MAGYRRSGAGQFINATTINDQMDRQRAAYENRNNARNASPALGVGRDTKQLFSQEGMPDDIFSLSVRTFGDLDELASPGNPDFLIGSSLSSYGAGENFNMFNDVENRIDRPNKKGPNLVTPDIDNLSAATDDQQTSQFEEKERGFGWRDGRNEPATETARIGTYFSRHYNVEGNLENRPVLGEAKSPEDDQNIEYNQPII